MEGSVLDLGDHLSSCGYCDATDTFYSHGMTSSRLTVQAYQGLLDIGWRRSGCYLYKPDLKRSCCPQYTIRLPVDTFVPTRSQKRTLKRLQRYLEGGDLHPKNNTQENPQFNDKYKPNKRHKVDAVCTLFKILLKDLLEEFLLGERLARMDVAVIVNRPSSKQHKRFTAKNVFLSSPFCITLYHKIAAFQSTKQWNSAHTIALQFCELFKNHSLQFLDKLNLASTDLDKIQTFLCQTKIHEINGYLNFSHELDPELAEAEVLIILADYFHPTGPISKVQATCPKEEIKSTSPSYSDGFYKESGNPRDFKMEFVPTQFIHEEYELYKKYQTSVHGDSEASCSRERYSKFLVDTPLEQIDPIKGQIPEPGFGTFHIQYRIDRKLVAVEVVDILPCCVSSKYLFWDPDFAPLSLGRLSALKDIQWIQEANIPGFKYYYMGFYIHSCKKMRYKAEYFPSQLLCPENFLWVEFNSAVKQILDREKYCPLSTVTGVDLAEEQKFDFGTNWTEMDVSLCTVVSDGITVKFGEYINRLQTLLERLQGRDDLIRRVEITLHNFTTRLKALLKLLRNVGHQLEFQIPHYLPAIHYER